MVAGDTEVVRAAGCEVRGPASRASAAAEAPSGGPSIRPLIVVLVCRPEASGFTACPRSSRHPGDCPLLGGTQGAAWRLRGPMRQPSSLFGQALLRIALSLPVQDYGAGLCPVLHQHLVGRRRVAPVEAVRDQLRQAQLSARRSSPAAIKSKSSSVLRAGVHGLYGVSNCGWEPLCAPMIVRLGELQ